VEKPDLNPFEKWSAANSPLFLHQLMTAVRQIHKANSQPTHRHFTVERIMPEIIKTNKRLLYWVKPRYFSNKLNTSITEILRHMLSSWLQSTWYTIMRLNNIPMKLKICRIFFDNMKATLYWCCLQKSKWSSTEWLISIQLKQNHQTA